jgi:hypothetical protein
MSFNQSIEDKIKVEGWTGEGTNKVLLTAVCHRNELPLAKGVLMTLYNAYPCYWDVEFQNDTLAFWCGLHPNYGCRLRYKDLNKGLKVIRQKGRELVERIQAGACQ